MENRELNIAHFSFRDDYGAMKAAYELHKTLLQRGIKSSFFVREKTRDDDSIIELGYDDSTEERLNRIINKLYFEENKKSAGTAPVNFDCLGVGWSRTLENKLKDYDVFHIHWVAGFLSMDNICQLSKMGKPIVWTMHDFHAFTGGCHCPELCKGYESDCSKCPELRRNYLDITKSILLEKQYKYSKDIQIVTASEWLRKIVFRSKIFHDNPCEVIPIGIDTECFVSKNKSEVKQKLGLSADTKVILAGAQALFQNVKGYVHFKHVLDFINADAYCKELIKKQELILLTFGYNGTVEDHESGFPIVNMGFIRERERLCEIYNAADVFVFPSVQDTFGMTAVEAMSCGVPTVAFDVSAMSDIIISGVNGYKAELNDYAAMASYIIQILKENPINAEACRKRIVEHYSLESEAEKMIQFYHKLIDKPIRFEDKQREKQENEDLERFIHKCSFEIVMGNAPRQRMNMFMQDILLEYNPEFVTPQYKVRKLLEKQIIDNKKNIYIYGAGDYGKRTLKELEKHRVCIRGFWDLDERKKGQLIEGYPIWLPAKKEGLKKKVIIVAGANYADMIKCLMELGYIYCQDFY